ncbi:MAG: Asp-tRNA(Asn)/Glu-tRNA(Gln) amidotransferase GatCAB subunit A, partial [Salinibacterium sp.]
MSDSLTRLTAAELATQLNAGEVSSAEVTTAHLNRIAEIDGDVRAYLHVSTEALATATSIDEARSRGEKLHELAGVPVAIKDVLCTIGMPTTAGSRILEGWIPPYDATPVAKLRAAGLVPLGKTNMDEF